MAVNNDNPDSIDAKLERIGRHIAKANQARVSLEETSIDAPCEPVEAKPEEEAAEVPKVEPPKWKAIKPVAKRSLPRLSPDRTQQQDFFVADIFDAALKDDIASMEHPLFALKAGDKRARVYERNGCKVSVLPGFHGCATIYDKDLWIYCISQLVEAKNQNININRTVRFTMYDFLKATNRDTGGRAYSLAAQMLERLTSTRIETNIDIEGFRERGFFGLIDAARVVERDKDERMIAVEVDLPRWLFASIDAMQVLTISRDYFRIRKALDRRIYELARKHCGAQASWTVTLESLREKSGSTAPLKKFRFDFKELAKSNDLPDYRIRFDEAADAVTFYAKSRRGYQAELQKLLPDLAGRFGIPAKKERKKRSK